jgi:hypothetical protein
MMICIVVYCLSYARRKNDYRKINIFSIVVATAAAAASTIRSLIVNSIFVPKLNFGSSSALRIEIPSENEKGLF